MGMGAIVDARLKEDILVLSDLEKNLIVSLLVSFKIHLLKNDENND